MTRPSRARVWAAWIAGMALCFGALSPAVSGLLRGPMPLGQFGQLEQVGPAGLAAICTSMGPRTVALDARSGDPVQPSAPVTPADHLFQHCPCCSLGLPGLGWAQAPGFRLRLLTLRQPPPEGVVAAVRGAAVWLAAQPRGPPRRG